MEYLTPVTEIIEENLLLQRMRQIQKQIKKLSMNKIRNEVCIFGYLQDTPDDSKNFYYGKSRIAKHLLGIVKTCEDIGLQCTIYKH